MTPKRTLRRLRDAISALRVLAGNEVLPREDAELYAATLSAYRSELLSASEDTGEPERIAGQAESLLREAGDFARDRADYDPETYPDGPEGLATLFDA